MSSPALQWPQGHHGCFRLKKLSKAVVEQREEAGRLRRHSDIESRASIAFAMPDLHRCKRRASWGDQRPPASITVTGRAIIDRSESTRELQVSRIGVRQHVGDSVIQGR